MPEIVTQKDLRAAHSMPFCYLCGKPFAPGDERTKDHVPPKALFAVEDRSPPLILPVHPTCNGAESGRDELIGQLVACLRGDHPREERLRLSVHLFGLRGSSNPVAGVSDLPLMKIVFRWVRGFHAALYRTPLPDRGGMIHAPMPEFDLAPDGRLVQFPVPECRPHLTRLFKEQVAAGRTDGVTCFNGKCQYRCSWLTFDQGQPFCLFALRIYNWEEFGDERGGKRGCVGYYFADPPSGATSGTRIHIAVPNLVPLDPFAP
jgi:hypothetical protein